MTCPDPQQLLDYAAGRLPAAERDALAAHLGDCADCVVLAGEALVDHRQAPTKDGSPLAGLRREAELERRAPPQRIGRYLVLELLGAGGMGEVLLAYDPSLDRRVALKLAQRRSGDDTRGLEQRLEREAQALARSADRHVVAVFDTGKVDGRPYVAMEYVPGTTLKVWLSTPRTRAQILRVFVEAARGLAAAHRVGVVHRDFKPDNVLIDVKEQARVTDFGLATLQEAPDPAAITLDGSDDETQQVFGTQAGVVMGTPGYMPPEQWDARLTDARSDQFSFCVALHEALLGERPFFKPSVRGTRPSFARTPDSVKRLKEQPAPVRAVLSRGLSIDPDGRFESMDALVAELERALRPSRARWAALATLVVGVGVSAATLAARSPCHGALERISAPRTNLPASLPPALINRISERSAGLEARWAEAWNTACVETHERREQPNEVLAFRNDCLSRQAQRYALVLSQVASPSEEVRSAALEALELSPRPEVCLAVEPALTVETPAADRRAHITSLRQQVQAARVEVEVGRYDEATTSLQALETPVRAAGFRPLTAEFAWAQGQLALRERDFKSARARLEEALTAAIVARDLDTAGRVGAELLFVTGGPLGLVEEAELVDGLTGGVVARAQSPDLEGKWENSRAVVAMDRGRFDDARAHALKARALREQVFGPDDLETSKTIANLGLIASRNGKDEEAEKFMREELAIRERALGPEHPQVAHSLINLALAIVDRSPEDSVALAQRGLAIRLRVLGDTHRLTEHSRRQLANVLTWAGRFEEARALQEQLLSRLAAGSLEAGRLLSAMAVTELEAGSLDAALLRCRAAQAIFEVKAPSSEAALFEREREAEILIAAAKGAEALPLLTPLVKHWRQQPDSASRLADVLVLSAKASLLLHQPALAPAEEALQLLAPLGWPAHRLAHVQFVRGRATWAAGQREAGIVLVKQAGSGKTKRYQGNGGVAGPAPVIKVM